MAADWLATRHVSGNSDAHRVPQVIGSPQNVVLASALERGALLDGIRRGRLWVAESRAVDVSFSASAAGRPAGIGERLAIGDTELVTVALNVTGAPAAVVRLFTDEGLIFQTPLPASGPGTVTWTTAPTAFRPGRHRRRRRVPAR